MKNEKGQLIKENKTSSRKNLKNIISVLTAGFVIFLLLLSGPAKAFVINFSADKNNVHAGEFVTFTASVDISPGENVPVQKLVLNLDNNEKNIHKKCIFSTDGRIISGCEGISIVKLSSDGTGYGYQFGYAYGYGYNFGYGYGYTESLSYQIRLNTECYEPGEYETKLSAYIGSEIFSKQGEVLKIIPEECDDEECYEELESSLTMDEGYPKQLDIKFICSAEGGSGDFSYDYDFGDGTTMLGGESEELHRYAKSGNYSVSCTVHDLVTGQESTSELSFELIYNIIKNKHHILGKGTIAKADDFNKLCLNSWKCTEWSSCLEGYQYRNCGQTRSDCMTANKPSETRECSIGLDDNEKSKFLDLTNIYNPKKEKVVRENIESVKQEDVKQAVVILGTQEGAVLMLLVVLIGMTLSLIIIILVKKTVRRKKIRHLRKIAYRPNKI